MSNFAHGNSEKDTGSHQRPVGHVSNDTVLAMPAPTNAQIIAYLRRIHANRSSGAGQSHIGGGREGQEEIWDEDHLMPASNIATIMRKGVIPPYGIILDDSLELTRTATSDFITLVTCQARERGKKENREVLTGADLIWALENLGFTEYIEPISVYLSRYAQFGESSNSSQKERELREKCF